LHIAQNGALVRLGQVVSVRQPIARSGNTGYSYGPHLHFEVYRVLDGERSEPIPLYFSTSEGPLVAPQQGKVYRGPRR
jgi:murein DD-endopeptidase MepM/ murein hydrolase activator NlpD